ncbi:hypothetical protein [Levilactobacillus brevis]|uniref:hypothetical protein n=1 Tax=Levilactobacillus brevis TaxID=1580 RepID=UPI0031D37C63
MNRHELVMNLKRIPENVNMENINRAFAEYEEDVEREQKSNFSILLQEEPEEVDEWRTLATPKEVTEREFLTSNLSVRYPHSFFYREESDTDNIISECTQNVEVGENQTGVIYHNQSVAA